jgi:[Skp1-protein]-hydroxyproline N-acetylglucosaminyltransferase
LNEEVNKYHPFENKQFFIHSKTDENSSPWSSSKNLRTIILDYRFATGPCYARHLAQSLHRGEDYILQIDSHMRFRRNWDVYLLNQLQKCPNPSKTVLTTYPPGYIPIGSTDGSMSKTVENNFIVPHNEIRGTVLVPWKFDSDGILRQKSRLLNDLVNSSDSNDNIPCLLYAAGFNFSSSAVLFDCPYERHLHHLFFGEEISIAARLYTHGYDLYTVPQTVCYHLWDRSYRPTVQTDFGNNDSTTAKINTTTNNGGNNDEMKTQSSNQEALTRSREIMRRNSINHVKQQLLVNTNNIETLRRLGLGLDRNVVDFAKDLNVDFQNEIIYPGSENGQLDKSCFVTTS